jgi:D-isomer specific 2-hydroxyacid dehydrogenase, NAD binding domain
LAVLRRLKPFDVKLRYTDLHRLPPDIEQELGVTFHDSTAGMVPLCDVVTINAPLYPGTQGLFNDQFLATMKRGAYIVNTARGKICDRQPDDLPVLVDVDPLRGRAGAEPGHRFHVAPLGEVLAHRRPGAHRLGDLGDGEEPLGSHVRPETRLGDQEVARADPDEVGHDRGVPGGDVSERAGVHEYRGVLECLQQVGLDGLARDDGHGAGGIELFGRDWLAVARVADDDPAEAGAQVPQ